MQMSKNTEGVIFLKKQNISTRFAGNRCRSNVRFIPQTCGEGAREARPRLSACLLHSAHASLSFILFFPFPFFSFSFFSLLFTELKGEQTLNENR
jgi:hypothetical protein